MMLQQRQQHRQCAASGSSRPALARVAAAPSPPRPRAVAVAARSARLGPSSPITSSGVLLVLNSRRQPLQPQQQPRGGHAQHVVCRGFGGGGGNRGPSSSGPAPTNLFSPVYLAIFAGYAALLLLRNPYIYAGLTIAAVLPQNSAVTSLNNLVLLFYESGLFANFAEAVYCVRLVTWLSIGFMLGSFALFS